MAKLLVSKLTRFAQRSTVSRPNQICSHDSGKANHMSDELMHIKDLVPDPKNRRKHTPRNIGMIVDALHKVGAARSIVIDENNEVLAGNATIEAAAEAGITQLTVIDADGDEIVAVRRTGLTSDQKRDLAMFDNRTAELAEWDVDQLLQDIEAGVDLSALFYESEISDLINGVSDAGASVSGPVEYSSKVESPVYSPNNEKPSIEELYDIQKLTDLEAAILKSSLSDDEKKFLVYAAHRHVVFNYSKIADFYAHSNKAVQELMEVSALVIIDFDQAIENGFVNLHGTLKALASDDNQ
jgi:hypothetical protein